MSINDLPIVILKYMGLFMENDLESFAKFAITNKRHLNTFPYILKIFSNAQKKHKDMKIENQNLEYYLNLANHDGNILHQSFLGNREVDFDFIKFLIEKKSNINNKNQYDENTALHLAAKSKSTSLEMMKFLIEKKSDLNLKNNAGITALHLSCENENADLPIIQLLVNNSADLNVTDIVDVAPLQYACKREKISFEIIKYLGDYF